jgi:hypothetical protein
MTPCVSRAKAAGRDALAINPQTAARFCVYLEAQGTAPISTGPYSGRSSTTTSAGRGTAATPLLPAASFESSGVRAAPAPNSGRILALIEGFLNQGVLDGLDEWTPEQGTPQGAVCSPLLSNIYLDPLDQLMEARGFAMVRYADDFVVPCRSRQEAAALAAV